MYNQGVAIRWSFVFKIPSEEVAVKAKTIKALLQQHRCAEPAGIICMTRQRS